MIQDKRVQAQQLAERRGLGPGLLNSRKTKEAEWGRHLMVKGWGCWELGDGRFHILVSWCGLVRFV